ncbi:hypothetical protein [Devosia sp. 2618]|uniref:MotE family protein n=1 Tax=Devosia sp. 2618 TaxID=3156454 RepID=UPI003396432B
MTRIRLLPVVVMAVAALLVLKTLGLVTNGGYVLTGIGVARAAGGGSAPSAAADHGDGSATMAGEPTIEDTSPTLSDSAPTIGAQAPAAAAGGHGAPAAGAEQAAATPVAVAPTPVTALAAGTNCFVANATLSETGELVLAPASSAAAGDHGGAAAEPAPAAPADGSFAPGMTADCLPSGDAVPMQVNLNGQPTPLANNDGTSATEQQLLARLANRRNELQQYEQDLALRASIVDAAEKRIEERSATLQALEAQISSLVDQRTEMESGQFAGIVSMYETMKPKDAANIFNNLDMDVLLRVAKTMAPRKMAPILAVMDAPRAQELTVKMAALADRPSTEMTPADLAALPQIVGQ